MNQAMPPPDNADVQALRSQSWFHELERRVLEIWRQGEGDLTIEVRNSPSDAAGRKRKMVKMESGTTFRYSEK